MNTNYTPAITRIRSKTIATFFMSALLVLFHGVLIAQPLSGTKTVCTSGCDYTSLSGLTGLFDDINNNGLGGNLVVTINSDLTETGDVGLNDITIGSANTITIQPGAAMLYTISGNIISAVAPVGLIKLNGADNVAIDGSFSSSGQYLLFRNASPVAFGGSTQPVLNFTNSATNNAVSNCIIESNATNGGRSPVLVNSVGTNSLTINGCDIRNSTGGTIGNPNTAISSTGTGNTVQILNNNIYNFTQYGISLSGTAGGCTVSGNSLYSTLANTNTGVIGIYISSNGGHTVSNNYIGGSAPLCAGTWTNSADQNFTGIQMNNSMPTPSSIQGNTIQNINLSNIGGFNSSCILMDLGTGSYDVGTVTGNTLGHQIDPNSIVVATEGADGTIGIRCNGSSGTVNISNNTIANITTTSTLFGVMSIRGIDHSGGTTLDVSNNDIHSLFNSNNTTDAVTGIYSSGNAANKTFNGNMIYDLETSDATLATATKGIVITAGTNTLSSNRIYNLRSMSPNGSLAGIHMSGGSGVLTNNQIAITNSVNSNDINIDGIVSSGSNTPTLYYNSIYIAGAANSGAANSYAFRRSGSGTSVIIDNLFFNERAGGAGHHYAIGNTNGSPSTGWGVNASNYNLLVSSGTTYLGEWGSGNNNDFVNWKTASSGDGNSWSTAAASVPALNLFMDADNGNLDINTANPEAWYVNGRGVQVPGQTADYGDPLAARSTTVPTGSTDIGADEMLPISSPPAPTVTGAIGVGNTQSFIFAGRTLGSIEWTAGTSLPTAIDWAYRPGIDPPNNLNLNNHYANAYWTIEPVGGSNYTYTLNLDYDPAMLGTTVENSLGISKKPQASTVWNYLASATVNTTAKSVTVTGQTSFSDFTLTDNISPLPVKLEFFNANARINFINIDWVTANENNVRMYELQRSGNGTDYTSLTIVNAKGDHSTYTYKDVTAAPGANYYRLRMTENTGDFTYSNTVTAMMDRSATDVVIYPNPSKGILNISISKKIMMPVKLEIIDMTGRIVYSTFVSTPEAVIDLKGLANGTYHLQYGEDGQNEMIKFIKN